MKRTKIIFWIFTVLLSAFMLFSAIPDALSTKEAVDFMTHLGYPVFIIPFLGIAKILGVIAILIPGFPRIKEWAYAGLAYDLLGALFSIIAVGGAGYGVLFMFVPLILLTGSYIFHHKILSAESIVRTGSL